MLRALALLGLALPTLAQSGGDTPQALGTVLANHPNLTTYYDLLMKHPQVLLQLPSYNGVTIIAPSNEAFESIPYTALNGIWNPDNETMTTAILEYHMLQGTVSMNAIEAGPSHMLPTLLKNPAFTNVTNGQHVLVTKQPGDLVVLTSSIGMRCSLIETDIPFQGGLIQIVDHLLIPPEGLWKTAETFGDSSFIGALYASGVMPELAISANVTIFAPTVEALTAVAEALDGLPTDYDYFADVMWYHVVPQRVLSSSMLIGNTTLPTVAKERPDEASNAHVEDTDAPKKLNIRQNGNDIYINSAKIVQPNVLFANGIIHFIDNVLNPNQDIAEPDPSSPTQSAVFHVFPDPVANPFTSDLPCTVDCPITRTTTVEPGKTDLWTTDVDDAGAASPRCTGQVAGAAMGLVGLGAGMALL